VLEDLLRAAQHWQHWSVSMSYPGSPQATEAVNRSLEDYLEQLGFPADARERIFHDTGGNYCAPPTP